MPEFAWRAAQPDGQLVEGRTEAGAADAVLRQLRERGLTPLRVQDAAEAPVAAGIALHHGEAAYGNVGSGARLDFTVIGRDVNLASRLAQINHRLGEPLAEVRGTVVDGGVEPEVVQQRAALLGPAGDADRETARRMTRDTLFQIYSMTKPVTAMAATAMATPRTAPVKRAE